MVETAAFDEIVLVLLPTTEVLEIMELELVSVHDVELVMLDTNKVEVLVNTSEELLDVGMTELVVSEEELTTYDVGATPGMDEEESRMARIST